MNLVLIVYYNNNKKDDGSTASTGVAQVSIAKHRNGATGVVDLLFIIPFTIIRK